MNKIHKNLEIYRDNSTPSSDGASVLTIKGQQVFRLIAQDANTDFQHTNPAQALRALFEGSLKSEQITFSLQECDSKQDVDFKSSCTLSIPTKYESVLVVCNPSTTCVDGVSSVELIQISVKGEELSC